MLETLILDPQCLLVRQPLAIMVRHSWTSHLAWSCWGLWTSIRRFNRPVVEEKHMHRLFSINPLCVYMLQVPAKSIALMNQVPRAMTT